MLAVLRLIFGFALFSVFAKALALARPYPLTEGTTDAGYVALAVIIGMANAVVWAPLIGRLMADPLTGAFTTGYPGDYRNHVVQFANKLAARRWRRCAVFFAFLDGIRHPDLPAAFALGMRHSKPGSWLERAFAREVWRFDNAENCLCAWKVLREAGKDPGIHRRPEVNLLVLSAQREVQPTPRPLVLPAAPPLPPPPRNPRIQLFEGAPSAEAPMESDAIPRVRIVTAAKTSETETNRPVATLVPKSAMAGRVPEGETVAEPGEMTEEPRRQQERLGLSERLRVLFTGRTSH